MAAGPKDFSSGDKIKCDVDVELLTLASAAGDGADDQVSMVCVDMHKSKILLVDKKIMFIIFTAS